MKLLKKNKAIVACAGSGKTRWIVDTALGLGDSKILITTYTLDNVAQIKQYIVDQKGFIPENITVISWFSFLLQDGVRPYQNYLLKNDQRVRSIKFISKTNRFHKKEDYLDKSSDIYSYKVAEFVYECNKKSKGLITNRLEKMYQHIFIDELQDMASYDLEFIESVFKSQIEVNIVADPRQGTFSTANVAKNKQYRKSNIYKWLENMQKNDLVEISEKTECQRCNQTICDFADGLFPDLPRSISLNLKATGHDGIFHIKKTDVTDYMNKYKPVVLRYNRKEKAQGLPALNFGESKGQNFDRVLIFTTKPMREYLSTGDLEQAGDKHKFYVAVTRARYSVAFVI